MELDLIYPLLMNRALSLQPAIVVFALFLSSLLFGIAGLLLAVPLAAVVQVLARRLWVERMDQTGVDPNPPLKKIERPPERGPLRHVLGVVKHR